MGLAPGANAHVGHAAQRDRAGRNVQQEVNRSRAARREKDDKLTRSWGRIILKMALLTHNSFVAEEYIKITKIHLKCR